MLGPEAKGVQSPLDVHDSTIGLRAA
jgi:hypothetical protein